MTVSAELPDLKNPNKEGWVQNTKSGAFGWCPLKSDKPSDEWPTWVKSSGYEYPLLKKLLAGGLAECSDEIMEKADEKFDDDAGDDKKGQFSYYPGGTCALLTDWVNDDGEPECEGGGAINFLHLHYCTME